MEIKEIYNLLKVPIDGKSIQHKTFSGIGRSIKRVYYSLSYSMMPKQKSSMNRIINEPKRKSLNRIHSVFNVVYREHCHTAINMVHLR